MKESGRKRIDELRLNRKNSDDKTEKSGIPKTVMSRIPENTNNRKFGKTEEEGGLLWRSTAPGITRNF